MNIFDYIDHESSNIALVEGTEELDYKTLYMLVKQRAKYLKFSGAKRVATVLENGIDWVIFDLACQLAEICFIPLPHFFSAQQIQHTVSTTGIDTLFVSKDSTCKLGNIESINDFEGLNCIRLAHESVAELPRSTSKITFTSGSTGTPKGACLSFKNQLIVAQSLVGAIDIKQPKHLCILPLSTLLENIAGVYAPLLAGGTVVLTDSQSLGLHGSSMLNPGQLLSTISAAQPDSLIIVPELLMLLTGAVAKGWKMPESLKFIAVGGSKVSADLLQRAYDLNLPVYQGYGLSECASVVCLCTAEHNRIGSVGQVLDHAHIEIIEGEITINGNNFLGYVGDKSSWYPETVASGDLAEVDEDGFYTISGRKKNLIISSFGRNISPEWVESECTQSGLVQQCVVFGDAKPWCVAMIALPNPQITEQEVNIWIQQLNESLPDYAQIKNWSILSEKLSYENGCLTENGKPKRDVIGKQFQSTLDSLFTAPHASYLKQEQNQ